MLELERADIHELSRPDGARRGHVRNKRWQDDIWGVIYKPSNFDPAKKYPVIELIYAGPQGSFVPKTFGVRSSPLLSWSLVSSSFK